jgi:hypothetical protein
MNGTHQLLVYADDVNLLGEENINIIKESTEVQLDASKKLGLEVNARKLSICSYLVTRLQDKIII